MKRMHIFLPVSLIKKLRVLSKQTGVSVSELVRNAVFDMLDAERLKDANKDKQSRKY